MGYKFSRIINNYWTTVFIPSYLKFRYYALVNYFKTFKFQGNSYRYFYHWYNTTWENERTVEIPIICKFINENQKGNILEIGNVLSHYFNIKHDVVDKYEKADGVINEDVVDFQPQKKYSLIISISTLEHVGWDETPCEPKKIFPALKNLKDTLAPGGKLVVTIPLGQNPILDKFIETRKIKFTNNYYLKRISKSNRWMELDPEFPGVVDGSFSPPASLLFVGVYNKL